MKNRTMSGETIMTQQPVWKCIGHIGDVDPIAYGGGFVYEDETGVYAPEVSLFEPHSDEEWHKSEGETPVDVFRILLERNSEGEWWFDKLDSIASYIGSTLEDVKTMANGTTTERALLYQSLVSYYGAENFGSSPVTMSEDEAYTMYADEMKMSLNRRT